VSGNKRASPRYERLGRGAICAECRECKGGERCQAIRANLPRYSGIRFTSDGFDCALPVSIDSHSHCSFACRYCFSDNLMQHAAQVQNPIGQMSLPTLERIFAGEGGEGGARYRQALRYDLVGRGFNYPCPIRLGAINDPCDNIERNQGWLLEFIKLAVRYRQPVRMSTKGIVLQQPEYLDALSAAPELFWVAFSTISPDDDLLSRIDRRAPLASERLQTMAALSAIGVKTSLRFRPMLPMVSDRTAHYPTAYRTLIEQAARAGACAVSYEVAFVPGIQNRDVRRRWQALSHLIGLDFTRLYSSFGPRIACMRPSYTWTEDIMHAVRNVSHECGLVVGISDPVWKQLGDTGCCCGILPDDPVFGNWQRESATNQLLLAQHDGRELRFNDIIPAWAYTCRLAGLVYPGVGPKAAFKQRHTYWSDVLKKTWNDLRGGRGPLRYFQGALLPSRLEDNDFVYKWNGLARAYPEKTPGWSVDRADVYDDAGRVGYVYEGGFGRRLAD